MARTLSDIYDEHDKQYSAQYPTLVVYLLRRFLRGDTIDKRQQQTLQKAGLLNEEGKLTFSGRIYATRIHKDDEKVHRKDKVTYDR